MANIGQYWPISKVFTTTQLVAIPWLAYSGSEKSQEILEVFLAGKNHRTLNGGYQR